MTFSFLHLEWSHLLDDVAGEIVEQGGVIAPPVNAIELALRLSISVAMDSEQTTRARHKQIMQQHTIFLKPDARPERIQWAAAHELGEVYAWRVFEQLEETNDEIPLAAQREEVANLLASRIMLPSKWFLSDMHESENDLYQLKEIYQTASYELIAMRLLDDSAQKIITICDQGKITRRKSNMQQSPNSMTSLEQACRQSAHQTGERSSQRDASMNVKCYPIHEANWKREIIITTPMAIDYW